jgi:hypothetical protein
MTRYGLSDFPQFKPVLAIQRGKFAHAHCLPRTRCPAVPEPMIRTS